MPGNAGFCDCRNRFSRRFDGLEALPLPGPIFLHADACGRHPEDGGFPDPLRTHRLTLNAYARGRHLTAREYIEDGRVEPAIERLFARPDVKYIHVRDTGAGCYDLRLERANRFVTGRAASP